MGPEIKTQKDLLLQSNTYAIMSFVAFTFTGLFYCP